MRTERAVASETRCRSSASRLLVGHHRGRAVDVRDLAVLLLGDQRDLLVLLRALAFETPVDLGQLLLLRLLHQRDAPIALRLLLRELPLDVGELLLPGLADQHDLAIATHLLELERLAELRLLAPTGLFGGVDVALGAHLLQLLVVVDLLLLHRHALIEDVDLLVSDLLRLLVRDLPILVGAGEGFLLLDLEEVELSLELLLADRHRGPLFGVMHPAPRVRGDLGDDLQAFRVEDVVGVEELLATLLEGDDGDLLQREAVGVEALDHARLHGLREALAVLVQLVQGLGRGVAPQRAHDLRLQEVSHLFGVEGALPEAPRGREQLVLAAADVGVELRDHVDADLVGSEHGLVARAAHDELDGLQGDPGHLVEHRQHRRAPAQAHLGAEEAGADEAHVRGRTLVHPDRDDVEDRDDDDREDDEGNQGFHCRRSRFLESRGSLRPLVSRRISAARIPSMRSRGNGAAPRRVHGRDAILLPLEPARTGKGGHPSQLIH